MRVHGLSFSKASASYSARFRAAHTVAGVRFHRSREERRFQRESFVGRAWLYSPRQHDRKGARRGRSATEDLVFKLNERPPLKPEKVNMLVFLWKKTCKYCQREPVLVLLSFCFRLKSLLSLPFTSTSTLPYGGFPSFFLLFI